MTILAAQGVNGYVAAAYLVFLAIVILYIAIIGSKLSRIERQANELNDLAEKRGL